MKGVECIGMSGTRTGWGYYECWLSGTCVYSACVYADLFAEGTY